MNLADYKALSFDCYGTLIDWEAGIAAVVVPWADEVGLDLDAERLLAALELMWARGEREIHVPTLTQALRALDGERRAARVTIPS